MTNPEMPKKLLYPSLLSITALFLNACGPAELIKVSDGHYTIKGDDTRLSVLCAGDVEENPTATIDFGPGSNTFIAGYINPNSESPNYDGWNSKSVPIPAYSSSKGEYSTEIMTKLGIIDILATGATAYDINAPEDCEVVVD